MRRPYAVWGRYDAAMSDRLLEIDAAFDPVTQQLVGVLTASLDDQLRRLNDTVAGLSVEQLEWRPGPGHNSVGMLLAHLAMVEIWWLTCAPFGVDERPEVYAEYARIIGLSGEDDGMPQPPDGAFPEALRGKTLADYQDMLSKARARVREVLLAWSDADLSLTIEMRNKTFARRWMLYHVLEHFAAHYGGIGRLLHDMRDAGVLSPA